MGRRPSVSTAVLLGCALLATACGTTVSQQAGQVTGTGLAVSGPDSPTTEGPAAGALDDGLGSAPTAPGQAAPRPAGGEAPVAGPAPAGEAPGAVTTTGTRPQVKAPGITATTISIGAMTATGAANFQKQLGVKGASGDQTAMIRSVVDWVNKRGGIAGRKVRLVLYDVPVEQAVSNPSSAYQAACAAFTQDDEVFAVASLLSTVPDNFYECVQKSGALVVAVSTPASSRFYRRWDGAFYSPGNPSYTRVLAHSVDALWDAGWLTSSSKVGVVGYDTEDARSTITDGLLPALKRKGLAITADFYTSTDTSMAGAYSSGVLRFKSRGVDRVFFAPGGQPYYFATTAEQSAYRPLYSMSSLEYPALMATNVPADQLRGSAGVGWSPGFDLDPASAAKVPTPGMPQCLEALRGAGQDLSTGSTLAIGTWICDHWFFLRDALAGAPELSRAGFSAAVDGLGSGFRSASTFRTLFAPGRLRDGAAAYRLNRFDDACSCYRYASPVRPFP